MINSSRDHLNETSPNFAAVSTSISRSPVEVSAANIADTGKLSGSASGIGSRRNSGNRGNRMPVWQIVLIALAISLIAFLIVSTQGYVEGQEFSPTLFQARDFHFYELPLLHLQMTPIRRSSATPSTAVYVRQNALLGTVSAANDGIWHLVYLSRGMSGKTPADAELLMTQLSLGKANAPYWRTWSIDHPELAKIFWPIIQRLAQRELYVLMPRLFELAQQANDAHELKATLEDQLRQEYARLIEDMQDAGRDDLAAQLRIEATADDPAAPSSPPTPIDAMKPAPSGRQHPSKHSAPLPTT